MKDEKLYCLLATKNSDQNLPACGKVLSPLSLKLWKSPVPPRDVSVLLCSQCSFAQKGFSLPAV